MWLVFLLNKWIMISKNSPLFFASRNYKFWNKDVAEINHLNYKSNLGSWSRQSVPLLLEEEALIFVCSRLWKWIVVEFRFLSIYSEIGFLILSLHIQRYICLLWLDAVVSKLSFFNVWWVRFSYHWNPLTTLF